MASDVNRRTADAGAWHRRRAERVVRNSRRAVNVLLLPVAIRNQGKEDPADQGRGHEDEVLNSTYWFHDGPFRSVTGVAALQAAPGPARPPQARCLISGSQQAPRQFRCHLAPPGRRAAPRPRPLSPRLSHLWISGYAAVSERGRGNLVPLLVASGAVPDPHAGCALRARRCPPHRARLAFLYPYGTFGKFQGDSSPPDDP